MATCAAWPAPPGAKPNRGDARRFSVEESLDLSPDRCPGWLLEAAGNGRPRGMAIARAKPRAIQNPAYRPAGTAPRTSGGRSFLEEVLNWSMFPDLAQTGRSAKSAAMSRYTRSSLEVASN